VGASHYAGAQVPIESREQLNAVLWQQRTVEYRALALQAYRAATLRLPAVRASRHSASVEQQHAGGFAKKPPAIVLDVDESVLDNSPYTAMLVSEGRRFDPESWAAWVGEARAGGIPGAREFVARARAAGFRVVFITNRECRRGGPYDAQGRSLDCPQKSATLDNLRAVLGYRPAQADLLLRFERADQQDSDKRSRRLEVARTHRIAMLIGDDLNDFIAPGEYDPERHGSHWGATNGTPWIALPNPAYGSWQGSFPDLSQKYDALIAWNVPPAGGTLRLVSWNLEWLADPRRLEDSGFWPRCAALGWPRRRLAEDLPPCDAYRREGLRSAAGYEHRKLAPLRRRLAELAAQHIDVLAVQETGGPAALQAVLPAGYRVACFTTRTDAQNLGYAVREAAKLEVACREIAASSQVTDGVGARIGLEMTLRAEDGAVPPALTLLNVHLKAGCPEGRLDRASNADCASFQRQVPALETWIEETAAGGMPFAILGDFNRNIEGEIAGGFPARSDGSDPAGPLNPATLRNLWPEINDIDPPQSAMQLVAVDRSAARAAPSCHERLDHMVVSETLKAGLAPRSLGLDRVSGALLASAGASDHCPLYAALRFK
jgi:acid phosphatase